ncbi:class F sortase [Kineococcus sp. SYSU DK003]|uniref:class F sortase n=1 Tax=Kineococcus sp. SYSU DK003 TaxID=3383124 RepID=UPI003D7C5585
MTARLVPAAALAVVGCVLLGSWASSRPQQDDFSTAVARAAPSTAPSPTLTPTPTPTPTPTSATGVGRRSAVLVGVPEPPVPRHVSSAGPGIDAPVTPVGVDERGQVAVPADGSVVGWYRWSSPAGPSGSTVLAGHVDTRAGGPGALFGLSDVEPGERVRLRLSDGSELGYEVVSRQAHGKAELPVRELFRKDGPPALVLITCGGDFDEETRRYAENVVVTAVPSP